MKRILFAILIILSLSHLAFAGEIVDVVEKVESDNSNPVRINLELGAGVFDITSAKLDDNIVAHIIGEYDKRKFTYDLEFQEKRKISDLEFATETKRKRLNDDDFENNWEFSFTTKRELRLDLDIGAAKVDFDLGGLSISEMILDVGAVDAQIDFSSPNYISMDVLEIDAGACDLEIRNIGNARFEEFSFDGGMGSFLLDFSGDFKSQSTANIDVGMGSIDIIIPDNIGVRVYTDDGWFSSIDIPRSKLKRVRSEKGMYETRDFDDADTQLILHLNIGMGSADISFK